MLIDSAGEGALVIIAEQTINDRGGDPDETGLRLRFERMPDDCTRLHVTSAKLPNGGAVFYFDVNGSCVSRLKPSSAYYECKKGSHDGTA